MHAGAGLIMGLSIFGKLGRQHVALKVVNWSSKQANGSTSNPHVLASCPMTTVLEQAQARLISPSQPSSRSGISLRNCSS